LDNNTVIKVNNLGKKYIIGEKTRAYETLRDSIANGLKRIGKFGTNSAKQANQTNEFWALEDISFEIKQGDVVGIIGHNGAGKSTLLKILSRITEPTKGTADIYGRVGSLLEVGTGFHQELTGRENLYLSGAILGMKKSDIDLRFDEIVAFAGVEKFVDTPIKHYSSGMSLRLGFAVAAHLEPDILLVDEVLAVGDLEFQKKCLNKMENVATEGRTVLFVSHNMASIKELCQTALVLKDGQIDYYGDVVNGIQHYSRNITNMNAGDGPAFNNKGFVKLFINEGLEQTCIYNTETFEITADLLLPNDIYRADIHCFMDDAEGTQIIHNRQLKFKKLKKGFHRINAQVPPLYLKPGVYILYFKLVGETRDAEGSSLTRFFSERLLVDISDKTDMFSGKVRAIILPLVKWNVSSDEQEATEMAFDLVT
jgi:lipopolysaccharide transport system ATP-binding protein